MTSTQKRGLAVERVRGSPAVKIDYLECSICRDLLWQPVACETCETPFCSPCIDQWLANNPLRCPNRCDIYIERKCPPFITKLLSELQIVCFYRSNGCKQTISYEALNKHEIECDYQSKQCPGCDLKVLQKDFSPHKSICGFIKLTCKDCKLNYKRNEADAKHTENLCLKKRIKRLEYESNESKREMKRLNSQLIEMRKLNSILTQKIITFEDLYSDINGLLAIPNEYKGLKWTKISYMHESFALKKFPKSGYATSFMPGGSLHLAFFSEEASIGLESSNETFNLVSLSASAAWNDELQLTISGYRNSIRVNNRNIVLLFGRPQPISLQWRNIDKVVLKPSGGYVHPEIGDKAGTHVALTQLVINNLNEREADSSSIED